MNEIGTVTVRADIRPALDALEHFRRSLRLLSDEAKREGVKLDVTININTSASAES